MRASTRTFEETRVVPGYPSYAVSASGRVGRIGTSAWLRPSPAKRGGYLVVSLWQNGKGRTRPVHQLVALAFHGPRPSPAHEVAHGDGDNLHNHRSNLRWATRAENEADKVRHGRSNRGERNGSARIPDAQIGDIIRRIDALPKSSGGARIRKGELPRLAAEYGVTASCLHQIYVGTRRTS